jgi:S-(hydroxymethyl)glutathione dehydrogenase/alcohol dehydrogenase
MNNNLAAVLIKQNKELALMEVDDPHLLEGQVRVKILKTAICGTQVGEWLGTRGEDKYLPHCLGHEAIGEVLEIGNRVNFISKGDIVIVSWIKSNKKKSAPAPIYRSLKTGEVINSGECATFIRRGVYPENRLTKVNSENIQNYYPLLGCALLTACGVIRNIYKEQILFGESGVVVGLGGIGLAIALILHSMGYEITGIDTKKNIKIYRKLELPIQLQTLDQKKIINKRFCVMAAGSVEAIEAGWSMLSVNDGIGFILANPPANQKLSLVTKELLYGKRLIGIGEKDSDPETDVPRMRSYLDYRPEITKFLVRAEYSFSSISQALEDAAKNGGARLIINVD